MREATVVVDDLSDRLRWIRHLAECGAPDWREEANRSFADVLALTGELGQALVDGMFSVTVGLDVKPAKPLLRSVT